MANTQNNETGALVAGLRALPFWADLQAEHQKYITSELIEMRMATSNLGRGEHLSNIKNVLSPYDLALFSFLNHPELIGVSARSGYRLISDYEDAIRCLRKAVTSELIKQGVELLKSNRREALGAYQKAFISLLTNGVEPPDDAAGAVRYVRMLRDEYVRLTREDAKKPKPKSDIRDTENYITLRMIRKLRSDLKKLPRDKRELYLDIVVGTALDYSKIPEKTFRPMAIPPEIRRTAQMDDDDDEIITTPRRRKVRG